MSHRHLSHLVSISVGMVLLCAFIGSAAAEEEAEVETPTETAKPETPAKKTVTILLPRELISQDPATRIRGIQIVANNGQKEAYPKLHSMALHDPVPEVRQYACWSMGKLELKQSIPTLKRIRDNDDSPLVGISAIRALDRLGVESPPPPPPEEPKPTCKKDKDCKKGHHCTEGVCEPPKKQQVTTGWTLEASIIGFVASGVIGGLTVYAALFPEQLLPSIPLAAGATVVTLITVPSVNSGSKSVRKYDGVNGSLTLRVLGWTAFGLHIAGSLTLAGLIPLHWIYEDDNGNGWTPPTSWIIGNGAVGMASVIFLSIETLIARKQALRLMKKAESKPVDSKTAPEKERTVSVVPVVSPTFHRSGGVGFTAGVVCTF